LLDRKTILEGHVDAGWIWGTSPFFERFYGGGIGSIRGFSFRGVSPRSGPDDDPIGGDFALTGSLQLSFPLAGDNLRGVVFTDAGTVEESVKIGTIRSSVGAGIRLVIPFLGQTPIALDFAFPLSKNSEDETQIFSFSFGFSR
jgi:outer membrane protein insertion porin family